jgi:hypothetical protein
MQIKVRSILGAERIEPLSTILKPGEFLNFSVKDVNSKCLAACVIKCSTCLMW